MYWTYIDWISKKWDKYWFVNETQVRIETWLALIFAIFSFISIVFLWYLTIPTYIIWALFFDFLYKVFVEPRSFVFWKISEIIVSKFWNNKKVFVWAVQKRFAWFIGLILSFLAFYCILIISWTLYSKWIAVDVYLWFLEKSIPAFMAVPFNPSIIACILCIVFMFLESVFWYCVWCQIYKKLVEKNILKEIKWQNCVNWACEIKK